MTVNDHKDSKTALLADYLLAASPDSLYLINTDSNDIYWPESMRLSNVESSAEQLLGQAVRGFPARLVVYTSDARATDTVFFSFGFRKLQVEGNSESTSDTRWYEFRLSHYKQQPHWLNARFWANPERFELDYDADIYSDEEE